MFRKKKPSGIEQSKESFQWVRDFLNASTIATLDLADKEKARPSLMRFLQNPLYVLSEKTENRAQLKDWVHQAVNDFVHNILGDQYRAILNQGSKKKDKERGKKERGKMFFCQSPWLSDQTISALQLMMEHVDDFFYENRDALHASYKNRDGSINESTLREVKDEMCKGMMTEMVRIAGANALSGQEQQGQDVLTALQAYSTFLINSLYDASKKAKQPFLKTLANVDINHFFTEAINEEINKGTPNGPVSTRLLKDEILTEIQRKVLYRNAISKQIIPIRETFVNLHKIFHLTKKLAEQETRLLNAYDSYQNKDTKSDALRSSLTEIEQALSAIQRDAEYKEAALGSESSTRLMTAKLKQNPPVELTGPSDSRMPAAAAAGPDADDIVRSPSTSPGVATSSPASSGSTKTPRGGDSSGDDESVKKPSPRQI